MPEGITTATELPDNDGDPVAAERLRALYSVDEAGALRPACR